MATLNKLLKGAAKLGRKTKSEDLNIKDIGFGGVYAPKAKRLIFRAEYRSSSGGGKYLTALSFASTPVDAETKPTKSRHLSVKVKGTKAQFVNLEKPKAGKTKCACFCECTDYIVTWWIANKQVDAHAGPPPASESVLKKYKGRGVGVPKNPDMVPGDER
jgi:hypothetical protein